MKLNKCSHPTQLLCAFLCFRYAQFYTKIATQFVRVLQALSACRFEGANLKPKQEIEVRGGIKNNTNLKAFSRFVN